MKSDPVLLLFDIDGTLLTTAGAGVQSMKTVGVELFGDHFSFDRIKFGGMLDPLIFSEAATHSGLTDHERHHDSFHDAYIRELENELARRSSDVGPMPGILPLLEQLRMRQAEQGDMILGMLTGNYTRAVPLKLYAAGIDPDWFSIKALGDEAPTRRELTVLAMRKYELRIGRRPDPDRVIVIGDTPRDIDCAKAHGCIAFCVATGTFSVEALREAGADYVVADLTDPEPLLRLLI